MRLPPLLLIRLLAMPRPLLPLSSLVPHTRAEASLDAHLKAFDDKVAKDLIEARKQRDLDAATAAKNAADAHLAANDARVAWEKDQLERGQNQDRLKHVNENTSAKPSEILGKHDERERANGRLLKALASF